MSRPKREGTAYARYSARSDGPATACAATSSALGHTEATALSSTCSTAQLSGQSVQVPPVSGPNARSLARRSLPAELPRQCSRQSARLAHTAACGHRHLVSYEA